MVKLANGLYDLLITREIERELSRLKSSRRSDRDELEPADAGVVLARHIAGVVREALRGVPEAERPNRQAEICNEILRGLAATLPQEIGDDDYLIEPPRRLM